MQREKSSGLSDLFRLVCNPRPSGVCDPLQRRLGLAVAPQCALGVARCSAVAGLQAGRSFSPLSAPIPHRCQASRSALTHPRLKWQDRKSVV